MRMSQREIGQQMRRLREKYEGLNNRILSEVMGWVLMCGDEGWGYYRGDEFMSYSHLKWSTNLVDAMELLAPMDWQLHTCDMGYFCKVWGEEPGAYSEASGDTIAEAICLAVLDLKPRAPDASRDPERIEKKND